MNELPVDGQTSISGNIYYEPGDADARVNSLPWILGNLKIISVKEKCKKKCKMSQFTEHLWPTVVNILHFLLETSDMYQNRNSHTYDT